MSECKGDCNGGCASSCGGASEEDAKKAILAVLNYLGKDYLERLFNWMDGMFMSKEESEIMADLGLKEGEQIDFQKFFDFYAPEDLRTLNGEVPNLRIVMIAISNRNIFEKILKSI